MSSLTVVVLVVGSELKSLMDETLHSSTNLCQSAVIHTRTGSNSSAVFKKLTLPVRAQGVGDRMDLFVILTVKNRT